VNGLVAGKAGIQGAQSDLAAWCITIGDIVK
jgi:hypothetical protein